MEKLYENPLVANKLLLMKNLFNTNIFEGGYVVDNLKEFNTISSQLSSVKVNFYHEVRDLIFVFIAKIWSGLFVPINEFFYGYSTLKFHDFFGAILSKEM